MLRICQQLTPRYGLPSDFETRRQIALMLPIENLTCDVLILGAGGAGMLAALHVTSVNPRVDRHCREGALGPERCVCAPTATLK